MNFKAVIFDLDGTLLNTIDDIMESMNTVLRNSGYKEHDSEAYKYFVGNGMRNLVKRALPEEARDEANIDLHFNAIKEEYDKRLDRNTHPYDGIPALLNSLMEKGIKTAVLSNKVDKFTKLTIAKFFPRHKFEAVIGERQSVPRKPDPTSALEISSQLGIPAKEFLYLGDTSVDMETAVAAGMYPVGALWGFRKADELIAGGAKVLIPQPAFLIDLI